MVPKFIHRDHGDFKTVEIHLPFVIQQWLDFPTEKQHIRLLTELLPTVLVSETFVVC